MSELRKLRTFVDWIFIFFVISSGVTTLAVGPPNDAFVIIMGLICIMFTIALRMIISFGINMESDKKPRPSSTRHE